MEDNSKRLLKIKVIEMRISALKYFLACLLFLAVNYRGNAICSSIQLNSIDTTPINILIVSEDVKCFGQSTGTANALISGGIEPYTIHWSNNATTPKIINLKTGIYTVMVYDAVGQFQIASVNIKEPKKLEINLTNFMFTCNTKPQTIYSTVTGGEMPYTYGWSTGETTPDILADGKVLYTLSVTDANSCMTSGMVMFVNNFVSPYINIVNTEVFNCFKDLAQITAESSPNTTFHWTPEANIVSGQGTATPVVNKPGLYTVMVKDTFNECFNLSSTIVTGILPLTSKLTINNLACFGDTASSATISLSGGQKPYSYTQSCCDSVIELNNLNAGFYSIIIKDNTTCADTVEFEITQPKLLTAQLNPIDLYYPNINSGKAYCYPEGGTPPYQILWSNGQSGDSIDSLSAGKYELTVTDSKGCIYVQWFYINDHQCNMVFDFNVSSPIQCYSSSGSFCADVKGGVFPYNYVWTNNENSSCLFNVTAGKYGVTVTDAMDCKAIKLIDFSQPTELSILSGLYYIQSESGLDFNDAAISFIPAGGTPPYNIEFDNGINGHLPAGKNIATVTDAKGCTKQFVFNIPEFNCKKFGIHSASFNVNTYCPNKLDSLCITGESGGKSPYSYLWSNGNSNACIYTYPDTGLVVTITDSTNCSNIFHPYDYVFEKVDALLKVNDATVGKNNGSIQITNITGGSPPYIILWVNGSSQSLLTDLAPGIYCATITDDYGCEYVFCDEVKLKTSAEELFNANWSLYPNPSNEFLYLKPNHPVSKTIYWKILDIKGQIIMESTELNFKDVVRIVTRNLTPGSYYIQINQDPDKYLSQFQKE
ncbi:MAG TPA: T9SS type A sorting domain-containing protein [Saprospiraceae bacterium]|nr:T9SS type A sorting domain-containing protein [Saprospiraceae bacterium]